MLAGSPKMDEQSEHRLEIKRQFSDFLDQDHGLGEYPDKIKALLTKENVLRNRLRLDVDVHDLRQFDASLFQTLLTQPTECILPFEEALDELIRNAYPKVLQVLLALVPLSHKGHVPSMSEPSGPEQPALQ